MYSDKYRIIQCVFVVKVRNIDILLIDFELQKVKFWHEKGLYRRWLVYCRYKTQL